MDKPCLDMQVRLSELCYPTLDAIACCVAQETISLVGKFEHAEYG